MAFGKFADLLSDFDASTLYEVLPDFHNTRVRYENFLRAVRADACGRKNSVQAEIDWVNAHSDLCGKIVDKIASGEIPLRVTHNDTKISNILFDKPTGKVLCAIDLDTVMSSTSLNDFGDAIRSYANTGAEDDRNLDNVGLSIEMFRAYADGYLSQQRATMTQSELDWLAFSARYITFEQVLRFLMDYIDGDKYYKTAYADHNLVRTHAQYKLLCSMEQQYDQMCAIIKELAR